MQPRSGETFCDLDERRQRRQRTLDTVAQQYTIMKNYRRIRLPME